MLLKTGIRDQGSGIRGSLFVICAVCVICASGLAQVSRPKLNGLEARKGRDIQSELARAQAELPSATKEAARAQGAMTKAQAAVTANKDPKHTGALQGQLKSAQQRLTQAQTRQTQAQKRVPQVQAQLADWESKILKTHQADGTKFKVDWASDQIKPK
jgi:chromosome segregation ATPase